MTEDLEDGTYAVKLAVQMACTIRLVVNMDKDLPGSTGELPPLQLSFTSSATAKPAPPVAEQEASVGEEGAGEEERV